MSNEISSARRSTKRSVVAIAAVIQCLRSVSPAPVAVLAFVFAQARPVDPGALPPRPHITATRTPQPPVIDGRLDDAVWATAAPSDGVRAALPRRGRAAQRAHHRARAVRRQEPVRRHRLRAAERADRAPARPPRLADPVRRRLVRHRQPPHRRRARSTSRSTPPACCPTASTSTTPPTPATGTPSGKRRSPTPAAATRSSSASRCRCCASRRCPCRTGASRCGASSTRARRPTTGRSTRAAPRRYVPLFGRLDGLRDLAPRHAIELRPFVLGRGGHRAADADTTLETRLVGGRVRRRGRARARHQRADAGRDAEPRLRSGGGRHRHPEPVDVRDDVPGEAAVLPGGDRRVRDGAAAGLHAAHRAAARDAGAGVDGEPGRAAPIRRRSTARRSWSARSARAPPSA